MRKAVCIASLPCTVLCLLASSSSAAAQASASSSAGAVVASAGSTLSASELSALRGATEKYRDVDAALADGYMRDPTNMCVTSAAEGAPRQLGGMGVHYFRPDLLGLTGIEPRVHGTGMHTDFTQPAVLIYEPQADGTQQLVAIENLVWAQAWRDAGNTSPPTFHDNEYYYMHDHPATTADEAHGFEPHYELHLWLYRDNPNGLFAPFNPTAGCAHHAPEAH